MQCAHIPRREPTMSVNMRDWLRTTLGPLTSDYSNPQPSPAGQLDRGATPDPCTGSESKCSSPRPPASTQSVSRKARASLSSISSTGQQDEGQQDSGLLNGPCLPLMGCSCRGLQQALCGSFCRHSGRGEDTLQMREWTQDAEEEKLTAHLPGTSYHSPTECKGTVQRQPAPAVRFTFDQEVQCYAKDIQQSDDDNFCALRPLESPTDSYRLSIVHSPPDSDNNRHNSPTQTAHTWTRLRWTQIIDRVRDLCHRSHGSGDLGSEGETSTQSLVERPSPGRASSSIGSPQSTTTQISPQVTKQRVTMQKQQQQQHGYSAHRELSVKSEVAGEDLDDSDRDLNFSTDEEQPAAEPVLVEPGAVAGSSRSRVVTSVAQVNRLAKRTKARVNKIRRKLSVMNKVMAGSSRLREALASSSFSAVLDAVPVSKLISKDRSNMMETEVDDEEVYGGVAYEDNYGPKPEFHSEAEEESDNTDATLKILPDSDISDHANTQAIEYTNPGYSEKVPYTHEIIFGDSDSDKDSHINDELMDSCINSKMSEIAAAFTRKKCPRKPSSEISIEMQQCIEQQILLHMAAEAEISDDSLSGDDSADSEEETTDYAKIYDRYLLTTDDEDYDDNKNTVDDSGESSRMPDSRKDVSAPGEPDTLLSNVYHRTDIPFPSTSAAVSKVKLLEDRLDTLELVATNPKSLSLHTSSSQPTLSPTDNSDNVDNTDLSLPTRKRNFLQKIFNRKNSTGSLPMGMKLGMLKRQFRLTDHGASATREMSPLDEQVVKPKRAKTLKRKLVAFKKTASSFVQDTYSAASGLPDRLRSKSGSTSAIPTIHIVDVDVNEDLTQHHLDSTLSNDGFGNMDSTVDKIMTEQSGGDLTTAHERQQSRSESEQGHRDYKRTTSAPSEQGEDKKKDNLAENAMAAVSVNNLGEIIHIR